MALLPGLTWIGEFVVMPAFRAPRNHCAFNSCSMPVPQIVPVQAGDAWRRPSAVKEFVCECAWWWKPKARTRRGAWDCLDWPARSTSA